MGSGEDDETSMAKSWQPEVVKLLFHGNGILLAIDDDLRSVGIASGRQARERAGSLSLVLAGIAEGRLDESQLEMAEEHCPGILDLAAEVQLSRPDMETGTSPKEDDVEPEWAEQTAEVAASETTSLRSRPSKQAHKQPQGPKVVTKRVIKTPKVVPMVSVPTRPKVSLRFGQAR
jgi:hypothetical protein